MSIASDVGRGLVKNDRYSLLLVRAEVSTYAIWEILVPRQVARLLILRAIDQMHSLTELVTEMISWLHFLADAESP